MTNILPYLLVILTTLIGYGVSFFLIFQIKDLGRSAFIFLHYLIDIAVFGGLFAVYFKYQGGLKPFAVMVVAMVTIFVLEFIFWNFIYKGAINYLNFWDWLVPAFLIVASIYLVGVWLGG